MPALPQASDIIELTGTSLSSGFVSALILDAVIIGGECIEGLDPDAQVAALKWLTAHLIASTNDGATTTSRKLGDAQESYARAQTGNGLMGTAYGQQAIAIAPCLARKGRARAQIKVV